MRNCRVYIGVLGTRYGTDRRSRTGRSFSYTELEFETATEAGLHRLMFMLDTGAEDVGIPPTRLIDLAFGARQEEFRRVEDSQRLLGQGHPHTRSSRLGLADAYRAAGRDGDAEKLEPAIATT